MIKLSKNLQNACKKKKISIKDLSKSSGVPAPTIHGWISGKGVQNLGQLKKVASVLEEPFYELLFGEADPFSKIDGVMLSELFSGDVRVTIHKIHK